MTDAEIVCIETEPDVEVPENYRSFVANYPSQLEEITKESGGCFELSNSPERIIELNRAVRRTNGLDWPDEYFVIGESGCGDYYAIDMDDDESSVYLWNHELGYFSDEEEVPSLTEFAGDVLQSRERVAKIFARRRGLFAGLRDW